MYTMAVPLGWLCSCMGCGCPLDNRYHFYSSTYSQEDNCYRMVTTEITDTFTTDNRYYLITSQEGQQYMASVAEIQLRVCQPLTYGEAFQCVLVSNAKFF